MDDRGELMREKLIEILKQAEDATPCALDPSIDCKGKRCVDCVREASADRLIANGVVISDSETATRWIPVTEQTPKESGEYIVKIAYASAATALWYNPVEDVWFSDDYRDRYPVTHWMTMPELPKGE